jgi:hypothetical protein
VGRVTPDELVPVHLLDLPVPIAAATEEHFNELHREFVLIASSTLDDHHVPAGCSRSVTTVTADYAGLDDEPSRHLEQAIADGKTSLADHVLRLPPSAGGAAQALSDILDEAEEFCRDGHHLLTLAAPPDVVAYRHWYVEQIQLQVCGEGPCPGRGAVRLRTCASTTRTSRQLAPPPTGRSRVARARRGASMGTEPVGPSTSLRADPVAVSEPPQPWPGTPDSSFLAAVLTHLSTRSSRATPKGG